MALAQSLLFKVRTLSLSILFWKTNVCHHLCSSHNISSLCMRLSELQLQSRGEYYTVTKKTQVVKDSGQVLSPPTPWVRNTLEAQTACAGKNKRCLLKGL